MKKLALVLALILALLLTGCGQNFDEYASSYDKGEYVDNGYYPEAEMPTESAGFSTATTASEESAPAPQPEMPADSAEKIIYTADLTMETVTFDQTIASLEAAVKEYGGFTQDSSVSGDTSYGADGSVRLINRYAYYTVRIPSAKLDAFLTQTGTLGNVIYSNKSATNVTSAYTDLATRKASLEIEETRLLELIAQAEKIEDLIVLEDKLSEVRYEIESIEGSLRDYDRRIAYSTVTMTITEVRGYHDASPVARTFGERLGDAFGTGWYNFVEGLENFAVGMAEAAIPLLLLAAIVVVVIVIVKNHKKKKKAAAAKPAAAETQTPPETTAE